jgi:hypothetical protein
LRGLAPCRRSDRGVAEETIRSLGGESDSAEREGCDLDYAIVSPAWFNDDDEIDHETPRRGESFKGSVVSKKSVADLIVRLAQPPGVAVRDRLGVSKP